MKKLYMMLAISIFISSHAAAGWFRSRPDIIIEISSSSGLNQLFDEVAYRSNVYNRRYTQEAISFCQDPFSEVAVNLKERNKERLLATNNGAGLDLREQDLSNQNLQGANLANADLFHANLQNSNMRDAHLDNAHLQCVSAEGTNFEKAHLVAIKARHTRFDGANFRNADLAKAKLRESSLQHCCLTGANLASATIDNCQFKLADLTNACFIGACIKARRSQEGINAAACIDGAQFFATYFANKDEKQLLRQRGAYFGISSYDLYPNPKLIDQE